MARKDVNPGEKEKTIENRRYAWELRKAGHTIRDIAKVMNLGKTTIERYIKAIMAEHKIDAATVLEYKMLQNSKLDDALNEVWRKAKKGSLEDIDRMLKIEERRSKLLGLDAPVQSEQIGKPQIIIQAVPLPEVDEPE